MVVQSFSVARLKAVHNLFVSDKTARTHFLFRFFHHALKHLFCDSHFFHRFGVRAAGFGMGLFY